jgi:nucleoside triphosphate diphosphatase
VSDVAPVTRLLNIMARLRDPESGCPWDIQQTFASIAPYTIEEAYEVVDAIDRNDWAELKDELGDLLLQVVFHAQMAQEQGLFAFADVAEAICEKMQRRHPHVFADVHYADAEQQTRAWEELKRSERAARGHADTSALAGIARGLPEWQRAVKLQQKAAKVGFDWPTFEPVLEKLQEEIGEVRSEFEAAAAQPDDPSVQQRLLEEIGDVLFVCANVARHAKVDVGAALRAANQKFERRFRMMESLAANDGGLAGKSLQAQDQYWEQAKHAERETDG